MVFPIILATNKCGLVGNAYTSWTLGIPEHQLSTYQEYYGTKAFNPADLGCPPPLEGRDLNDPGLTEAAEDMDPSVLLPADLADLDPAWKSCSLLPLGLGRDPPRALQPATNMAPKLTDYQAHPTAVESIPSPHTLPKPPGPDPTSSSLPTEKRPPSAPDVTLDIAAAGLRKAPSGCLPISRSHTDLSNAAELARSFPNHLVSTMLSPQRPALGPRNEVMNSTERRTTTGTTLSGAAYISAISYAAYASGIDAWASALDSEYSALRVPPVAPSNPYMALPKHRSAKQLPSPTNMVSYLSQYPSEVEATSITETSASPEKLQSSSATSKSTLTPSSAKVPANFLDVQQPQSLPAAPPFLNPTENEEAQYESCHQDVVVDRSAITRDASTNLPHSVSVSSQPASLTLLTSQERSRRASSPDLAETPVSLLNLGSIQTFKSSVSSTGVTQESVGSHARTGASMTGFPIATPQVCAAGSDSLWWMGISLIIFVMLN